MRRVPLWVFSAPAIGALITLSATARAAGSDPEHERLGLEARAAVVFGGIPGFTHGAAFGFTVGLAAIVGPFRLGGDVIAGYSTAYHDQDERNGWYVGLLGTTGIAFPKAAVVPMVDLHFGTMLFDHLRKNAGQSTMDERVDGGFVAGATLGMSMPVSARAGLFAAVQGLYPLFDLKGFQQQPTERRIYPLLAQIGFHVF